MRNKLMVLALAGVLSVTSLMGCGDVPADVENNGGVSVVAGGEQASNSIKEDESVGAESTSEEEITPSSEEASSEEALSEALAIEEPYVEESEPSSEEAQAAVDNEWFTGLYSALLQDDYKTVMEILCGLENVREKCATCEYTEWAFWDYETAYRMTMDDGQVMGIIVYAHEDGYHEINAFVSCQPGDGFDYTGYGDHCVVMYGDGTYAYIKDGNQVISTNSGQGSFTMEEDDIWTVWHM